MKNTEHSADKFLPNKLAKHLIVRARRIQQRGNGTQHAASVSRRTYLWGWGATKSSITAAIYWPASQNVIKCMLTDTVLQPCDNSKTPETSKRRSFQNYNMQHQNTSKLSHCTTGNTLLPRASYRMGQNEVIRWRKHVTVPRHKPGERGRDVTRLWPLSRFNGTAQKEPGLWWLVTGHKPLELRHYSAVDCVPLQ
jgi:hypothetical protein